MRLSTRSIGALKQFVTGDNNLTPYPETRDDALRREIEARTRPTEQPRGR